MTRCKVCNARVKYWMNCADKDAPKVTDYRKDHCLWCRVLLRMKPEANGS